MNNKIVYIFLLFACFLWPAQNGYGKDFDTNLKKVKAEINRDNVKEAIKILGKIKVENEDQQERIDLLFGDIYLKINKPGKAIEFYEKVFATSDEDIESLGELGLSEANLRQGKLEESIEHANKSLAINANNIKGKIILAIAKTRNDEKNEALQILENLHQGHKNNSEVNLAIAGYHSTFDNNKEAIKILENFIKNKPDHITVLDQLANLYWIEGNKDKALEYKYKVFKYHEFNRNRSGKKETKQWILSIDPDYFEKKKPKPVLKKKKERHQKEEVEKYDQRKKEIEYEKFDFAGNYSGTGFVVGKGKYVITNHHVVDQARRIAVRNGLGKVSNAEIAAVSKEHDLAILKLNKKYKQYIVPKNFSTPKPGEDVISIGYPLAAIWGADLPIITQGIISKVGKIYFLTTTDINPGNSGGPIFNLNGNLVGISAKTLDKEKVAEIFKGPLPTSMGYGIRSDMLKEVFKYKESFPVRNMQYSKSKIYEEMLGKVVFVVVDVDPKSKIKNQ